MTIVRTANPSVGSDLGDLAVLHVPAAGQADGLQHAPVVRDEQDRARRRSRAPTPAARSRAGRGGSSARRARAGSRRGPAAARGRRASARRATATTRGRSTWWPPSPNLASSVRTSAVGQSGTSRANAVTSDSVALERAPAPGRPRRRGRPSRGRPRRPSAASRPSSSAEERRLARPVRAGHGDAVEPVELEVDRAEREAPRGTTACRRRPRRRHPTGPPTRSSSAAATPCAAPRRPSSRSIILSVCRALAACFSDVSPRKCLTCLSLSVALRRALRTPFSIHARCMRARGVAARRAGRRTPRTPRGPAAGRSSVRRGRSRSCRRRR